MGVDIRQLAPWAQKQIAQKIAEQNREQAKKLVQEQQEQKPNKYRNIPDERAADDGTSIKFKSKAEARRYDDLMILYRAGQIHELKLQPQFTLQEAYTLPNGKRIRAIRYDADFSYNTGSGLVVEDVKSKATKTRVYAMKKKLMQEKFGITITEIE